MHDSFDPYHKWLGIPPEEQPPDLYRLLSIKPLESDPDVIEAAADRQMAHLRTYQVGQHGQLSQRLLNEVAAARVVLLNAEKKVEYDARLRQQLQAEAAAAEAAAAKSLPVAEPIPPVRPAGQSPTEVLPHTAPAVSAIRPSARAAKKPFGGRTIAWVAAGVLLAMGLLVLILSSGGEPSPGSKRARSTSPGLANPAGEAPESKPPQPPPPAPPPDLPAESVQPSNVPPNNGSAAETPPAESSTAVAGTTPEPSDPAATPDQSDPPATPEPEPVGKPPVPSAEARKVIAGQLEELYDISKLKKPSEKVALARKLVELGERSNDPTEQFVLLYKAMELSGAGGDASLMLDAVDRIAERFQVDPLSVKAKVLTGFAAEATDSARIGSFIESADEVIDQAVAASRYDIATDLADRAYRLGQRSPGHKWRKQAHTRRVEVQKLQQSWQKSQAMLAKLEEQPDDPDANLAVGRWYCFERGEWQKGLPHLAKSGDTELKALATRELESPPAESAAQIKLADAWWDLAQSRKDDERTALLLRAGTWYVEALPSVTSTLVEIKVEQRMAEIGKFGKKVQDLSTQAADPAKGFSPGRWVDLLGAVDMAEGIVEGEWRMTRQGLATGPSEASRIALPVVVKGDYDLNVNLTRVAGGDTVVVTFPVGSNAASLYLGTGGGSKSGLQKADGLMYPDNTTVVQSGPLINGRPYSVAISVRTEGENAQIGATLNNRPLFRWAGKTSSLGSWGMPTKNQPGLGARLSTVVFHTARLRLVSGEAKLVKSVSLFRFQKSIEQPDCVECTAISPDGSTVAVAARNAGIAVWDVATGRLLHTLGGTQLYFNTVAFHPKGSSLASGGRGKAVKLWNPATGELLRTLIEYPNVHIFSLAFNRDGSLLAIGSGSERVHVIDPATGETRHSLKGHRTGLRSVVFSPAGSLLASRDSGGAVKIWDLAADKLRYSLDGHTGSVRSLAFSPDGATLASGSDDESVRLWDPATGKSKRTLDTDGVQVLAMAFSPDGSWLAATGHKGGDKLLIWETVTYELQQSSPVTAFAQWSTSLAFSPDGNTIITGAYDKLIKVWTRTAKPR